ncbi:alcohol dehydrogenase [Dyella lipolytica]|uniref:enoyl-[acyl-carrier-protein] reductase n=1 Tax=Dyella lipolytica TaxID=1867835 RepID=A0ABW8IY86_9GAMM|nr:zinc-dependent alcohol dehydrogenase family protein [Dyella lipolytica]GLQ45721.1 alcohol dehydrogenase [Dyella lipolytica]
MRALQISAYGNPSDVLHLADVPSPGAPGKGEVLIEIELAPLNKHDLLFMGGYFGGPAAPTVVGNEGYGRVAAVGPDVENVKVGDRVLAPVLSLTWSEQILAPAKTLFALPAADPLQLAQLGSNPPTAALLLSEYTDLKPGDWIVQNGANSGVGRSLIAIAKKRGFRTINLVRRDELIDEMKQAGGDIVLKDDPASVAKAVQTVGKDAIRLAVDSVGGGATDTLIQLLSDRGVLVTYAAATGQPLAINPLQLIGKHLTVKGFYLGDYDYLSKVLPAQIEAAPLIASGALRVPVAAVYPIAKIKDALEHVQQGGKVLLDFS